MTRSTGSPRVFLRRSVTLHTLLAIGLLVAVAAVHAALAPWLGIWQAVPPALAFLAAGGLAAAAWCRKQPAVIQIGPGSIGAFARDGACIAQGRLDGRVQWGDWLLVLDVDVGRRRSTLLVAADALPREAFRELAVRSRCASGR